MSGRFAWARWGRWARGAEKRQLRRRNLPWPAGPGAQSVANSGLKRPAWARRALDAELQEAGREQGPPGCRVLAERRRQRSVLTPAHVGVSAESESG